MFVANRNMASKHVFTHMFQISRLPRKLSRCPNSLYGIFTSPSCPFHIFSKATAPKSSMMPCSLHTHRVFMSLSAKRFFTIGIFCYAWCIFVFRFVVSHFFPLLIKKDHDNSEILTQNGHRQFCVKIIEFKNITKPTQNKNGLVTEISDTAPWKALTIGLWTLVRMVIGCGETGVRIFHIVPLRPQGAVNRQYNRCCFFYILAETRQKLCLRTQAAVLVTFLVLSTLYAMYAD